MSRIAFIASSPHSGSTLLEMLLSENPQCCGIGEAFQLLDPRNDVVARVGREMCGCGEKIGDCPLWRELLPSLQSRHGQSVALGYRQIAEQVHQRHPDAAYIIDSSKTLRALDALRESFGKDVLVIHLVRDVRAWLVSTQKAERRHHQQFRQGTRTGRQPRGLRRLLKRSRLLQCLSWYTHNKRIVNYVHRHQLKSLCVSYEQLCFRPEQSLRRITEFLELDDQVDRQESVRSSSHNVLGNRMRYEQPGDQRIAYDYRWLHSKEWMLPAFLLPHVTSYNRSLFHSANAER